MPIHNEKTRHLTFLTQLHIFFEMISIAWKAGAFHFLIIVITEIILSFFPLAQAWITKEIFNYITQSLFNNSVQSAIIKVLPLALGQILLEVVSTIFTSLISLENSELGRKISLNSRLNIFHKMEGIKGLAPFEDPETQSVIQMASQGLQMGPSQVVGIFTNLLRSLITFFSFIFVLLSFNKLLAILILFSAVPQLLMHLQMNRQRFVLSYENAPKQRLAGYFSSILTSLHFAKEIRLYDLGGHFIDGFECLTKDINNSQRIREHKELRGQTWLSLLSNIASGVAFICVINQALLGYVSIGDVTFYTSALTNVQVSLMAIISIFANINESALFFSSYKKLKGMPQPIMIADQPVKLSRLKKGIEFRNVSFRYSEDSPWILKNINLFIPAGQSLALVGLNGAGKTTLVKLLVRFYDPTEGHIYWDGVDISEFDPSVFRQHIGAIFQDFIRYELSAFENIAVGDIENIESDLMLEKVKEAAQKVGIHEVIESLPNGYQTILSRWMAEDQQGTNLSGGEWQKVALARLFVREAECLILDEPTAALDAKAEYDIYKSFLDLVSQKTCLLISHRFSTVRLANVIAVLQNGKIVEYGSHEKLLKSNGLYAELYKKQAERYK